MPGHICIHLLRQTTEIVFQDRQYQVLILPLPQPALEATQGPNERFLSPLPYKCYLFEVASVGD